MNDIQKYYLLQSGRWEKLLGVFMWVCVILMALLGVFFIVGAAAGLDLGDETALMSSKVGLIAMGVLYVLLAVLYYFFARYLCRSAKALKAWGSSDDDADLTDGLKYTKYFFQISGVLCIISFALIAVCLVAVIIGAIVAL